MEQRLILLNIFPVGYYYIVMLNLCIESACLTIDKFTLKWSNPWNEQSIAGFIVLAMFPLQFI